MYAHNPYNSVTFLEANARHEIKNKEWFLSMKAHRIEITLYITYQIR